ncbi:MAG: hypothetical protein QW609_02790 [Candidatus Aenigmatarchaeota archaeon]
MEEILRGLTESREKFSQPIRKKIYYAHENFVNVKKVLVVDEAQADF